MIPPLRIAVADDEHIMREYYQQTLPMLGHQVVCAVGTGQELVAFCRASPPDLMVSDVKMPDLDGIDAIQLISREAPIPAILVSAYHTPEIIQRANLEHILAYLVKPIKQADLEMAIGIAMQRFEQFRSLRQESANLRQALEDRKIIEQAKGILMKRAGLEEAAAFRRLQKLAMDKNQKLVEIAQMILLTDEAFEPS